MKIQKNAISGWMLKIIGTIINVFVNLRVTHKSLPQVKAHTVINLTFPPGVRKPELIVKELAQTTRTHSML